jgi:hypothetical protein
MKIFIFLLLFILLKVPTKAQGDTHQSLEFLVSPALNYRLFSSRNSDMNWLKDQQDSLQRFASGYGFQLNYEFEIGKSRSFFMGLAHSKQGYQYKYQAISGFQTFSLNYHYVQLSLGSNLYFRMNEFCQIVVQPSLLPSALLASESVYQQVDTYYKERSSIYPSSSKLSLNGQLAVGVLIRIDERWKFRSHLFYQQQLTPLTKGDLSCRLFSLGLQFGLSRSL